MQWVIRALDGVFSDASSANRRRVELSSGDWPMVRNALRTGVEQLTAQRRVLVDALIDQNRQIGYARRLRSKMRDWSAPSKPHVPRASAHMDRRPRAKRNPRIHDPRRQIDTHYDGIIAAVETRHLQRANDGINSKIRLINTRGHGNHPATNLPIIDLPQRRRNRPETTT